MPGIVKDYRINERIRAPQVLVIDELGQQLGVMATRDALNLANDRELDLVEVAPNVVPPVCRLLDYGKFRYIQTTKERELRKSQKSNVVRQVRFRTRTGEHDLQAKERTVQKLLAEGAKVKVSVMFRGREITHPELAVKLLRRVAEGFEGKANLEQAPSLEGRMMSIMLAPVIASPASTTDKPEEEHAEAENP